jgi:hypothetical protein
MQPTRKSRIIMQVKKDRKVILNSHTQQNDFTSCEDLTVRID